MLHSSSLSLAVKSFMKMSTASTNVPVSESSKSSGVPSSPTRPKHLAARSITEVTGHHHKHRHHPHIHHRNKERERDVKEGRGEGGTGRGDGQGQGQGQGQGASRSEGHTPSESRSASRPGSVFDGDGGGAERGLRDGYSRGERLGMERERERERGREREKMVKEGAVGDERGMSVLRAVELRNSLNSLNTFSNNTTSRLDNTYYSVLEKLSTLNSTITSLRELASLTRGLTEEFQADASELTDDATGQLDGFNNLQDQEARIAGLKSRVEKGRKKIGALAERVEGVRERVEGWELAEKKWQEKMRKRLRLLWMVGSVMVVIAAVVMGFQFTPARIQTQAQGGNAMAALNTTGLLGKVPSYEAMRNESRELKRDVLKKLGAGGHGGEEQEQEQEDPRLKVFDEL